MSISIQDIYDLLCIEYIIDPQYHICLSMSILSVYI